MAKSEKEELPSYEEMLDKAYEELPAKVQREERWEKPTFQSFIQGNKTIIKNFDSVAQNLRRDKEFIAKYFSKELAAPNSIEGGRLIIHTKVYDRVLNDKLNYFIDNYVICNECKKPDTKLADESGVTMLVCEACGARAPVKG